MVLTEVSFKKKVFSFVFVCMSMIFFSELCLAKDASESHRNVVYLPSKVLKENQGVIGIGQAAYDTVYKFSSREDFLTALRIVDEKAEPGKTEGTVIFKSVVTPALRKKFEPIVSGAGGAAANTIVSMSALGANAAYIAAFGEDKEAEDFSKALKSHGVKILNSPKRGAKTCTVTILVSPDGERTMISTSGSKLIETRDLQWGEIKKYKLLLVEGYILGDPELTGLLANLSAKVKANGSKVVLTMSDPAIIDKQRDAYQKLLPFSHYLIGNESQMFALFQNKNLKSVAIEALKNVKVFIATKGAKGSFIATKDDRGVVRFRSFKTEKVQNILDSTGAGDAFAAGFFYAQLRDADIGTSVQLGNKYAGYILQRMGVHPGDDLNQKLQIESIRGKKKNTH